MFNHLLIFSQNGDYHVNVHSQPANKVLLQLRDLYDFQVSFNDSQLSGYRVTLKGSYSSIAELLASIFNGTPFSFQNQGGVYVVYYDDSKLQPPPLLSTILFTGIVQDALSGEALPYSTVDINGELRISDINGRFTFQAFVEEWLSIKVTHLGYSAYDTTIVAKSKFNCELQPLDNILSEATVKGNMISYGTQMGNSLGQSRMNPRIASFLPGGNNNGISQMIELQPGIQKASTGFGGRSVWGGYPGHNLIIFDGITIYSYPRESEYIFPVNTFLVKDMIINKGAFGAHYGDRVGGIIELTGIDGNTNKEEVNMSADGTAINLMLSTPFKNKSSFVIAGRKSWFPGYQGYFNKNSSYHHQDDLDIWMPVNCNYGDVNMKYSGMSDNGDQYFVSFFGSWSDREDSLNYLNHSDFKYTEKVSGNQGGVSLFYGRIWANGVNSNLSATFSTAKSDKKSVSISDAFSNPENMFQQTFNQDVNEGKLNADNRFAINSKQFVEAGLTFHFTESEMNFPSPDTTLSRSSSMYQTTAYVRNNINVNRKLLMDIGLRLDYHHQIGQMFLHPRIKGTVNTGRSTKINFSWGVNSQYLSFMQILDSLGNYDFAWQGFEKKGDFLLSNVISAGWSYSGNGFVINAEVYNKTVEGMGRYRLLTNDLIFEKGQSRTTGVDVMLKKEFGKHLFMQSYSYNDTKEKFSEDTDYKTAPFSRKHELKSTLLLNFNPVKMSLSYTYGSPTTSQQEANILTGDYRRLDAMVSYQRKVMNGNLELGLMGYNLFNTANISSLYLIKQPLSNSEYINIGQGGMPLYASLFIVFHF